jgi:WD40 repeat protein
MRLHVHTPWGTTVIEVDTRDTVAAVKQKILQNLKIPEDQREGDELDEPTWAENVMLVSDNKPMQDIHVLERYEEELRNSSTISLVINRHHTSSPQPSTLGAFSILPSEMRLHILSFLPFEDLILNISRLNKEWNKMVEDDALWKITFVRTWKQEVQEEEEKKKARREKIMEREYLRKQQQVEANYEKEKRELEEKYAKKRAKLEAKRKPQSWKGVFENHYITQMNWRSGYARLETINVGRTINCLLFDDESDLVVCGNHSADGQGGEIKFWNLKKNNCFMTITAHERWVRGLCWHGDRLFSCSNDKTVKVWDMNTGSLLQLYEGHENNVPMIHVSMFNNTMISCSRDQTVKIWDIEQGTCLRTLTGHLHAVNCILSNASYIISGDRGGNLKVWDTNEGKCVKNICTGLDVVQCLEFTGEGRGGGGELILGGGSARVDEKKYPFEVWDLSSGSPVKQLLGHTGFNWAMQFDPLNNKLVTGGADKTIRMWNLQSGQCEGEVADIEQGRLANHTDSIYTLRFATSRIVSGSKDKTIKIWNFSKDKQKQSKHHPQEEKDEEDVPGGGKKTGALPAPASSSTSTSRSGGATTGASGGGGGSGSGGRGIELGLLCTPLPGGI